MAAGEQWRVTRASEDRDWPGIWKVFREVISHGDTYSYPPYMSEDQAKDAWIRKGCRAYVVRDRDEVVDTPTIRTNTPGLGDHVANAGYMVHKDYRGRGIAQAMCSFSLKEAKRLGYEAMQFNFVVASNVLAVEVWKKMGFKIIGTVPRAFRHAKLGPTDVHIMHHSLEAL
jgi:GNAT superfamily N-acetyltransferase